MTPDCEACEGPPTRLCAPEVGEPCPVALGAFSAALSAWAGLSPADPPANDRGEAPAGFEDLSNVR